MRPDGPRDKIIGPATGPETPFPLRMHGTVVSGFGRGSKELGIPTANIPVDNVPWIEDAQSGVYFGWAGIQVPQTHPSHPHSSQTSNKSPDKSQQDAQAPSTPSPISTPTPNPTPEASVVPATAVKAGWRLFPMVMSIGYNPFYKNKVRTAEVHVLHQFAQDFYGSEMAISILGFIRPEYDYVSLEALIEDIKEDIEVTKRSLVREAWMRRAADPYLWGKYGDETN